MWIILIAGFIVILGCSDDNEEITGPPAEVVSDTIRVPADMSTIQAAIDAYDSGQVILVADGLYTGDGNRDLDFAGKSIMLISENGPTKTVIDCEGDSADWHLGVILVNRDNDAVIDGFTIRGGYTNHGAGILTASSSPTIRNCILTDNHATISGGAIRCKGGSPRFINCTIVDNSSAMVGGSMHVIGGATPVFENCIIAFSTEGGAVYSSDGTSIPEFTCSNIYGNIGGDWVDVIAGQAGIRGNISLDPLFCNTAQGDFRLESLSPCAPENNSCTALIGALPAGCQD
jgi:hypothetical protein